jgi:phospholipid transport system substrate-binding protein
MVNALSSHHNWAASETKTMKILVGLLILSIFLLPSDDCLAVEPITVLQQHISEGIRILKDPQYINDAQKKAQFQALLEISLFLFDFEEFSRRALAFHWRLFSGKEKKRFVGLFTQFLCNLYLTKIQTLYTDETVAYTSQTKLTDLRARVATMVFWRNQAIPADVWMQKRNDTWRVYDVHIVGVSFLRLYRAQFHSLLLKNSPEQVIDRIEAKIETQLRQNNNLPSP